MIIQITHNMCSFFFTDFSRPSAVVVKFITQCNKHCIDIFWFAVQFALVNDRSDVSVQCSVLIKGK